MATFLLLHGAWHDSQCWRLLTPLLEAKGHSVITPDLPGHGADASPPSRATLKAYVQEVLQQLEQPHSPVILLGHSMAGVVITEVAAQLPRKIERLIYLCAYLPNPGDSVFTLIARNRGHEPLAPIELAMEMSSDKRTCTINTDDIVPLFYANVPTPIADDARERFRVQGTLPLAAEARYDALAISAVPTTYICCTLDKVIPLHHQRRMLAGKDSIEVLELASDHSPFYSCPHELAGLLTSLAR